MKVHPHASRRNVPRLFEGRSTRVYDFAARRVLRRLYTRLAEDISLSAPQGGAVLDVGTGPGALLVEVGRSRPDLRLTGLDLSSDMIAAAERNLRPFGPSAAARVGDVTDIPFPDSSFDVIVSSFSLHHWDNPEEAVPELGRVIRPGGRLYIYDFSFAPFDSLAEAASARSLFAGQPALRSRIRTGVPFPRRCVRLVMVATRRETPTSVS